ncbi:hypothetical protein PITC_053200 [Penicillium italicum]|uniref:Uncharacterized protein n=1 Tax=Penicillium italicum TaxID=40296 RepID=A0A0A2KJP0_PENIT|nr:hypothetical protein PITC_053200 [Penicillium italicum]
MDILPFPGTHGFYMHEPHILDSGKTFVACVYGSLPVKLEEFGRPAEETWIVTGDLDNIAIQESNKFSASNAPATGPLGWDYARANAVDKNPAGDYIVSMRFIDTIYGDFDQKFTFSKQHGAKFVSSKNYIYMISLLNNTSDEDSNDEDVSSILHIELDTLSVTARVIKRVKRPDGKLTRLRGNTYILPNIIFVGWS